MLNDTVQEKYKTVAQFAASKGVKRLRIYRLIDEKVIIPELINGIQMIDTELYKDFDPLKKTPKEVDIISLTRHLRYLQREVTAMKHIVYEKQKK
jgi:hypothetical protein